MTKKTLKYVHTLNNSARLYMEKSTDVLHDVGHVARVVGHATRLAQAHKLSSKDTETLILAAWWHDVGRTITTGTSMIWMALMDDLISAIMLLFRAIRAKKLNPVVLKAVWILSVKVLGNNQTTKKLITRRNTRLLVYILQDADNLDLLNIKRYTTAYNLALSSSTRAWGYRAIVWWSFHSKKLYMKTQAARTYAERMVRELLTWIKQQHVFEWHASRFGKEWAEKTLKSIEKFFDTIVLINLQEGIQ